MASARRPGGLLAGLHGQLTAGLTHDGTATAPVVFTEGYVTQRDWWRVGLAMSVVNIAVWTTIGFVWWRIIGFW